MPVFIMVNPNFKVIEEKAEKGYARFVIEPLEPGFGNTLGVALRRVLLTNIEGAAVTSVKIDKVRHMFATLPGLKEDIIELILNIKGIRVKLADGKKEGKLMLKKSGPGEITTKDLEPTEGVEIVSTDHYLGSLANSKSKIEIEMIVEQGFGYSLAEERKISTIGVIPIDAIFSQIYEPRVDTSEQQVAISTTVSEDLLKMTVDELDLPTRIYISLKNAG